MARLVVALIRHGAYHQLPGVPSAHQPFALTELGRDQAHGCGRSIDAYARANGLTVHPVIDASAQLRAWQTGELIRASLPGVTAVESHEALAERGLGSAANLTVEQIEAALAADPRFEAPPPGWKSDSHYRLPLQGAESLMEAGTRVAEHLRARAAALHGHGLRRDTLKIIVAHGAALRHGAHKLGILPFERIAALSMFHATPVYFEVSENGRWRQVGGEWKVRARGETGLD
ncbi:MAG: histidine phosphatase family protein [Gammaproteobacteria bacterium]